MIEMRKSDQSPLASVRFATVAVLWTVTGCQQASTAKQVVEESEARYVREHPAGRYMLLPGKDGAVWRMDTTTGELRSCHEFSSKADKDGWEPVSIACIGPAKL